MGRGYVKLCQPCKQVNLIIIYSKTGQIANVAICLSICIVAIEHLHKSKLVKIKTL